MATMNVSLPSPMKASIERQVESRLHDAAAFKLQMRERHVGR